jgi:hypothetical protein
MFKKILFTALLCLGTAHAGSSIGIDINSDEVELLGAYNLNSAIGYTGGTGFMVDASYLHSETNDLFTLGFSGENALESAPGLIFGFGMKAAFTEDFSAFPLLGKVRYILPFDSDIPTTSFFASFAYAPSVLTFQDGKSYSELRAEADIEVISSMHIFAGYRNIDTDYEFRDYSLSDSFYGGLKFSF